MTVRRRKSLVNRRALVPVLALASQCWSLDFVHDQLVAVHSKLGMAIMIVIMGMRSATSALAVVGLATIFILPAVCLCSTMPAVVIRCPSNIIVIGVSGSIIGIASTVGVIGVAVVIKAMSVVTTMVGLMADVTAGEMKVTKGAAVIVAELMLFRHQAPQGRRGTQRLLAP